MTTQCSVLTWETSWTEETGGLQSMGSQRVGHNWETKQQQQSVVRAAVPLDILRENLILPSSIWSLGSSWLWPHHSCLCIWLHMEFLLCVCVCVKSPPALSYKDTSDGIQDPAWQSRVRMIIHHKILSNTECVHAKSLQSCLTLWDPMDYSTPSFSVHGIHQARILEWVAMPSSRGSPRPRGWTCGFCMAGGFIISEPPGKLLSNIVVVQSLSGVLFLAAL